MERKRMYICNQKVTFRTGEETRNIHIWQNSTYSNWGTMTKDMHSGNLHVINFLNSVDEKHRNRDSKQEMGL